MYAHRLGIAFGPEFSAAILEVADQFLFFRIDQDRRLSCSLELFDPPVGVFKLGIPVGMRASLQSFPVGLEAEAKLAQQAANQFLTDRETTFSQGPGKMALASAHPNQCRLGIAAGRRLYEVFQRGEKTGFSLCFWPAAAPWSTYAVLQARGASQFREPATDRTACDTRRLRYCCYSTSTGRMCLRCCEQPPGPLIEMRRERLDERLDPGLSIIQIPQTHQATESGHLKRV